MIIDTTNNLPSRWLALPTPIHQYNNFKNRYVVLDFIKSLRNVAQTMNLQSLVVVVLRLIALDFLLKCVVQVAPQIYQLAGLYQRSSFDGSRSLFVFPFLIVVGLAASAALLWVFALPIARFVTRSLPQDISFGALSLVDCYSIAFMAVGLFYIASHLPAVLNWTHYLFKTAASSSGNSWKDDVKWYDVWQSYIPFVVGVVLFVNGRRWAAALSIRQAAALFPIAPESEKNESDT